MNRGDWAGKRGWPAFLLLASTPGWLACAGDSASIDDASGNGASGEDAGEFASVDARVVVVVSDAEVAGTFAPLVDSFIADETGLYWYDGRGAVFARRAADPEVVELAPALDRSSGASFLEFVIGMADDEERLFVGQAFLQTGAIDYFPVPEFQPPGRLLVIPKNGDPARVVVELMDATITPIASDATRVIVHVQGANGGFYQLIRSSLELEPLPLRAPFYSSLRSGDTLYWSNNEYPPSLLRSRFDDAEPELVASMERNEFDVGPGYALTRQERLLEPDFVVAQNFVLHDAATGDERPFPGMGETISLETALDARHAYWFSYRGESPVMLPPTNPLFRLVRVDIESGALTLLNTPGFRLDAGARMIGQTAGHLYIQNAGEILAIEKP
jgi:hypothetical protein